MEVVSLGVRCHRFRCLQGPSQCRREEGARDGKHDRHVPCLQGQPLVSHLLLCGAAIASSLDYFQEKPAILIVLQNSSNFKREHLLTHFWNDRIGQKEKASRARNWPVGPQCVMPGLYYLDFFQLVEIRLHLTCK